MESTAITEDDLRRLIICPGCRMIHVKAPIKDGADACCSKCATVLYRCDKKLIERGLALNITALFFLGIASTFPLVSIDILGNQKFLTIPNAIFYLFESGFYLVGIAVAFLVLIIPIILDIIEILALILLKYEKSKKTTRELLILLSKLQPWGMSDIFLVSVLIALIKLIDYAQIHVGLSFWALITYAMINIYNIKVININELWSIKDKIFSAKQQ